MEQQMEISDSSTAVEEMIDRGEIMLSDLEHLLETLNRQEHISPAEHEGWLELTWSRSIQTCLQADLQIVFSNCVGASYLAMNR